jgi:hypothetical protein
VLLLSEAFWPQQNCDEVGQKTERRQGGKPKIKCHGTTSGVTAEVDVEQRRREQADDKADPNKVLHVEIP